jgi:hypothetical protein
MSDIGKGDWVEFIGPQSEIGPNGLWRSDLTIGNTYFVEALRERKTVCTRCGKHTWLRLTDVELIHSICLFRPLKKPPSETVKTSSKEPQFETTS